MSIWINDGGPVVQGCNRTGANAYPNEHLFTMPSVYATDGTAIRPGDLCVLFDLANSASAAIPALVTPTGFTVIGGCGATGVDDLGNGARCSASYKILTSADIGAVKTGMNGTENERKMVCVFKMSRPVQGVVVGGGVVSAPTGGNPASVLIVVPVSSIGNNLIMGMACGSSSISAVTWTPGVTNGYLSPADPGNETGSASSTRSAYAHYPSGETPANQTFDVGDFSGFDTTALCGFYLTLT